MMRVGFSPEVKNVLIMRASVVDMVELTFPTGVEEEIMGEITPADCVFSLNIEP